MMTNSRVNDLEDQDKRVNEMQCALMHAGALFEAIAFENIEPSAVTAASYFAEIALKQMDNDLAEDASTFAFSDFRDAKRGKAA